MLAAQLPEGRRQHPLKLAGGTLTTGRRVDGPDSLEVVKHAAGMLLAHLRFRSLERGKRLCVGSVCSKGDVDGTDA